MSEFVGHITFIKDSEQDLSQALAAVQAELDKVNAERDEISKRQQRLVGIRNALQSAYQSLLSERLHQEKLDKAEGKSHE